jgi:hypothetical protein
VATVLSESFEGTGLPSGWSETGAGTHDYDEASVVGHGSQSLRIVSSVQQDRVTSSTVTAVSTMYFHFMWRWASLGTSTNIFLLLSSGSNRLFVETTATGQIRFKHGSAHPVVTITDSVPVDTWVHIWGRYVQGSGADGVSDVGWSTDTTRPTSGTKFNSSADGQATTTVNALAVGAIANETHTMYFDQLILDDATYPDVSGGRASKNTRAFPLGVDIGMGWRM